MYKNANIKSKKELAQRLLDGEVFYSGDNKCYFDAKKRKNPFRIESIDMSDTWEKYAEMQIKTDWRDTVSPENPAICWVSDLNESERMGIVSVSRYNKNEKYKYKRETGVGWRYATPVKPEECYSED